MSGNETYKDRTNTYDTLNQYLFIMFIPFIRPDKPCKTK